MTFQIRHSTGKQLSGRSALEKKPSINKPRI